MALCEGLPVTYMCLCMHDLYSLPKNLADILLLVCDGCLDPIWGLVEAQTGIVCRDINPFRGISCIIITFWDKLNKN